MWWGGGGGVLVWFCAMWTTKELMSRLKLEVALGDCDLVRREMRRIREWTNKRAGKKKKENNQKKKKIIRKSEISRESVYYIITDYYTLIAVYCFVFVPIYQFKSSTNPPPLPISLSWLYYAPPSLFAFQWVIWYKNPHWSINLSPIELQLSLRICLIMKLLLWTTLLEKWFASETIDHCQSQYQF